MKKFLSLLIAVCAIISVTAISACKKKESDKTCYDIFAVYDAAESTLTGTVKLDFYNDTENEIVDLKFNMYGNAFREGAKYAPVSDTYKSKAYYAGESYGGMEITNVENCAGWNVGGEDENILSVTLQNSVFPEETVSVTISYTLRLAKINHRTGVSQTAVNLGNFYPVLCAYSTEGFIECNYYTCGDPFVSEVANYKVTLDYPAAYTAVTSGEPVSEKVDGERKKGEYVLNNARDFAIVLSDNFQKAEGAVGNIKVNYYYTDDKNAEKSLAAAVESLSYFINTFGDYSYPVYSVVQTGFCYGGMEYPALSMIAHDMNEDGNAYTIVHETAHQWWYAMVGSNQLKSPWQDEGLAEYSTVMFFEAHPDFGYTRNGIVKQATSAYRAFFTVYSQLQGSVDTSMDRALGEYSGEFEYNNISYNKGLILFETLRNSIGDDAFVRTLKNYFKAYNGSIATADDICGCFLKCGTDVEGLFRAFLEGKVII